jgi:putative membrane protein
MMWNRPFDMMYGSGDWGWFGPFHFIVPLLICGLIIAVIIFVVRRGFRSGDYPSLVGHRLAGLEVLEQRYARGEINRDEYLQKKADITG